MAELDWNDLRPFLAVARNGSLSLAARQIHGSVATLSRRIQALEQALGVVLFTRHSSGYLLTAEGNALLPRAEAIEQEILRLRSELDSGSAPPGGIVRLATAITIANRIVVPALPRLHKDFPGISLELSTGINDINMTRREADLALRLSRPEHGDLLLRSLGVIHHAIYGRRDQWAHILTGEASPAAPADFPSMETLRQCPAIGWEEQHQSLPMARWISEVWQPARIVLTANDLTTHIAAAEAGAGLAVLPCFCAAGNPLLCALSPTLPGLQRQLYLVSHHAARQSARVEVVARFLADSCRDFLGQLPVP